MTPRWVSYLVLTGFAVVTAMVWHLMGLELHALGDGFRNAMQFGRESFPPDWSVLDVARQGLVETLGIAFLGTMIGMVLSLPIAMLAASNLAPPLVSAPARALLAAIRVLPTLLWAILFVIMVGLGPLPGVLATAFYSIGYLGKLQYEAIEGLPAITLDTADAMGLPKWQKVRYVVVPEAANALVSQGIFMFEYNVRASTILGAVGAGGIGFYIIQYMRFYQYDRVFALLATIFVTVLVIDFVSLRIRRRFIEGGATLKRARLRDVFTGA